MESHNIGTQTPSVAAEDIYDWGGGGGGGGPKHKDDYIHETA